MKLKRIAVTAVIVTFMMSAAVFAESVTTVPEANIVKQSKEDRIKTDPEKWLEAKKAEIQKKLSEGKITKEEADRAIARIDAITAKINEFNKLSPAEKKEKVIRDFTAHMEKAVQEGRLTREEANKKLSEFKDRIGKWDGNGYPPFTGKVHGVFGQEKQKHMEDRVKGVLDKAVKDGKITQKQANSIMEYFKK
ncbi:MAG TPA: hypothetical protein VHT34_03695 [Clostridia bacterium]|nr:hypothetical protein [Clostridia bacterium]